MALNYKHINGETSTVNRITFNGQAVQQLRYAKFGEKIKRRLVQAVYSYHREQDRHFSD